MWTTLRINPYALASVRARSDGIFYLRDLGRANGKLRSLLLSFYFIFLFLFYFFSFIYFLFILFCRFSFFLFFFSFLFSFVFSFCFSLLRLKTTHVTSDTKMRRVSQPSASEFIIVWNIQRLQQYPPNIKLVVPIQWTDCCGTPALLSFLFLFLCSSHINV